VSEYNGETSIMRRPRPTRGCRAIKKNSLTEATKKIQSGEPRNFKCVPLEYKSTFTSVYEIDFEGNVIAT
jgi:hypothetical protein